MSMLNVTTDASVTVKTPADPIPEGAQHRSKAAKFNITGEAILCAIQLGAGSFHVHLELTAHGNVTAAPSLHVTYPYSYSTETGTKNTTNTVKGQLHAVEHGDKLTYSCCFTSDGNGVITVQLKGDQYRSFPRGSFDAVCTIYKA